MVVGARVVASAAGRSRSGWVGGRPGRRVGLVTLTVGAGSGRSAGWSAPGVGCRFGGLHGRAWTTGAIRRRRLRPMSHPIVAPTVRGRFIAAFSPRAFCCPEAGDAASGSQPDDAATGGWCSSDRAEGGPAGMLVSRETAGVMSRAVMARSRRSTWNLAGPLPWLCLAITRGWGWAESGFDGIVSPRARPFHVKQPDPQSRAKR